MSDLLNEHQAKIAQRVLAEEAQARTHLVVHLSGAHAYGFASQNSDLDLKAIHIEPTPSFLGLSKVKTSANRFEVIEGVEIDYTSNELGLAIRGVLQGDGNMLERILSLNPFMSGPELADLAEVARKNISLKFYNHYRGFASSQRKALEGAVEPRAKKALYVLRTALTGVHLLETGECIPDLTRLADTYGFDEAHRLIELKRSDEGATLPKSLLETLPKLLDRAFDRLDEARDRSCLPDVPDATEELEAWLIEARRRRL